MKNRVISILLTSILVVDSVGPYFEGLQTTTVFASNVVIETEKQMIQENVIFDTPKPTIEPTVEPTMEPTQTPEPTVIFVTPEPTIEPTPEPTKKPEKKYKDYNVPESSGFKSFMSYRCITSKSSPQYKLQATEAYTGKYGIRQVDGRFCVAIGSYFTTEIGTEFDLILENDTIIPCILADQKDDADTDSSNIITAHNGCLSEFVVDSQALYSNAKRMGDISFCDDSWKSPVKTIRIYN